MSANTFIAEKPVINPAWVILDTEDQWLAFSQTYGQDLSQPLVESSLLLDGLRCAACSGIIEQGLQAVPGIINVRVSMSKKRAVVVWSPAQTRPSSILAAIKRLGYDANPASHNESQLNITTKSRAAFWRWMVAGFCMMQVMMYATPSYFTKPGDMTGDIIHLLNWASWLLSIPVLLFSSSTFFSNALRDLKLRQISMDLPVALGIVITFVVSSAATFDPSGWWGHTVYFDSLTMFVFFLLSARLVEVKLHSKTLGALESLVSRIPENIERLNLDGSYTRVLNSQLKVGDTVRVSMGEAFPADGKIVLTNLSNNSTSVDESLLTGESTPILKNLHDRVIAGSYNLGQVVHIQLEAIGESTKYSQIVSLINQAAIEKPRLSQLADRIAKPFLLFVIISAVLAAAMLWNVDHGRALMTAAAILIVTCPCALSLATPAAMLASASAFVKRGILIKRLQAIESIADIDTIIFDKTGTLTDDHIEINSINHREDLSEMIVLTIAGAIAENSMHPISRALFNASRAQVNQDNITVELTDIQEQVGAGVSASLVDSVYSEHVHGQIKLGSAKYCEIKVADTSTQQVYLADENGWLATFNLQEKIKSNVAETIQRLKEMRLDIELLSGDQSHSVTKMAKAIGITQFQSACSPLDKLKRLHELKQQGKKVLMVGDGLNDGPILASALVSIAMGKGVPLTLAHADYILLNGDISQIPELIQHAQKTMSIIKQNIAWAIVYNLVSIPLAFIGVLSAWLAGLGMALSSIIVVANALRLTNFSTRPESQVIESTITRQFAANPVQAK